MRRVQRVQCVQCAQCVQCQSLHVIREVVRTSARLRGTIAEHSRYILPQADAAERRQLAEFLGRALRFLLEIAEHVLRTGACRREGALGPAVHWPCVALSVAHRGRTNRHFDSVTTRRLSL